jgi:hypothetical protein
MPTVSITKIQLRRGLAADLPGLPTSLSPLTFPIGLDEGELGYTTDKGRLFVGIGNDVPIAGMPNYNRSVFPYQNIEVLTENSPASVIFGGAFSDNQTAYIVSVPLAQNTVFQHMQVINSGTGVAQDFQIDLTGVGACAVITYFMFDPSNNPIRQGRITILWNSNLITTPQCTDEAQALISLYNNIQWQAVLTGSIGNQHVVLQYINLTGVSPTVYFRVDRLHP